MDQNSQIISFISNLYESRNFVENEFNQFNSEFLDLLNNGKIRAAEKDEKGNWQTNIWVKKRYFASFQIWEIKDTRLIRILLFLIKIRFNEALAT
jgi:tetrahydrodipicolinate N-succinyltransferase